MIELFLGFLTSAGPIGFGSLMKIVSGAFDTRNRNKEVERESQLLREVKERELDLEYFKLIYGDSSGASYSRATRRIVAVIGMLTFSSVVILSILWPSVQIVTFVPREVAGSGFEIGWGLLKFPNGAPLTAGVSTGHIALMGVIALEVILGFFFTPGGRK